MIADLAQVAPIWMPAAGFLLVLLMETVLPQKDSSTALSLTQLSLLGALLLAFGPVANGDTTVFAGMLALDRFTMCFQVLIAGIALLITVSCESYFKGWKLAATEAYALILAAVTGMMLVVAARDLMVLFLGIELLSIPLYVLTAYRRLQDTAVEGGFKYFLIGAFASSFLIYGIALVYGASGSTLYAQVARAAGTSSTLFTIGTAMMLIGLGFKIAAAPFHHWAPDVYQAAPTPVTGFMAAAVKTAAFGGLLRLAMEVLPATPALLKGLSVIAGLTMIMGNLGALLQTNWKRLLAYSSVAHAGYLLIGVIATIVSPESDAVSAVIFYLFTYAIMTVCAFTIMVFFLRENREGQDLSSLRGLSRTHPYLAFGLALCFLSMAGIPFTAGFFGKFYLLLMAWKADMVALSVLLILTSLLSLYYYLRVVVTLYMKAPSGSRSPTIQSRALSAVTLACGAAILVLGLYPAPLLEFLH